MRYLIWLLIIGCNSEVPTQSPELAVLKSRLSGITDSVTSQTDVLHDNTAILREIRDAVVVQLEEPEITVVELDRPIEFPPEGVRIDVPDETILEILESPEVAEIVAGAGRDAYVVKWTASWCGPCRKWNREELAKLEAAGIKVIELDVDANPEKAKQFKVVSVPAFSLCRKSTESLLSTKLLEYTSGEVIIAKIDQLLQKPQTVYTPTVTTAQPSGEHDYAPWVTPGKSRRTTQQLQQWVQSRYKRNSMLFADVMPRSDVWRHLTDHNFTADQVNGLSQWDARCLHDAVHQGQVGPWQ